MVSPTIDVLQCLWPRHGSMVRFRCSNAVGRRMLNSLLAKSRTLQMPTPCPKRCSTQRAGIAPPHAEGDGLSGVASDGESHAFISGPAAFVGGMPLTRAMNPWAMPEAST